MVYHYIVLAMILYSHRTVNKHTIQCDAIRKGGESDKVFALSPPSPSPHLSGVLCTVVLRAVKICDQGPLRIKPRNELVLEVA